MNPIMNFLKRFIFKIRNPLSNLQVFYIYQMNTADSVDIAGLKCKKCGFIKKNLSQQEVDSLNLPMPFIKGEEGFFYISKLNSDFLLRKRDKLIFINLGMEVSYDGECMNLEAIPMDELNLRIDMLLKKAAIAMLSNDSLTP